MTNYKIEVHTLTGSGIANEKNLKVGDIIDSKSIDEVSAAKFLKMGWISEVKEDVEDDSEKSWKSNHKTIDAKAEELGIEFPEDCTVKADKIKFIEDSLNEEEVL